MEKYCSDCIYLDTTDAKCDGIYKCKMCKKYRSANTGACEKFQRTYAKSNYEKQRLYDLGKSAEKENNHKHIDGYLIGYILLLIVAIIAKLLGY